MNTRTNAFSPQRRTLSIKVIMLLTLIISLIFGYFWLSPLVEAVYDVSPEELHEISEVADLVYQNGSYEEDITIPNDRGKDIVYTKTSQSNVQAKLDNGTTVTFDFTTGTSPVITSDVSPLTIIITKALTSLIFVVMPAELVVLTIYFCYCTSKRGPIKGVVKPDKPRALTTK